MKRQLLVAFYSSACFNIAYFLTASCAFGQNPDQVNLGDGKTPPSNAQLQDTADKARAKAAELRGAGVMRREAAMYEDLAARGEALKSRGTGGTHQVFIPDYSDRNSLNAAQIQMHVQSAIADMTQKSREIREEANRQIERDTARIRNEAQASVNRINNAAAQGLANLDALDRADSIQSKTQRGDGNKVRPAPNRVPDNARALEILAKEQLFPAESPSRQDSRSEEILNTALNGPTPMMPGMMETFQPGRATFDLPTPTQKPQRPPTLAASGNQINGVPQPDSGGKYSTRTGKGTMLTVNDGDVKRGPTKISGGISGGYLSPTQAKIARLGYASGAELANDYFKSRQILDHFKSSNAELERIRLELERLERSSAQLRALKGEVISAGKLGANLKFLAGFLNQENDIVAELLGPANKALFDTFVNCLGLAESAGERILETGKINGRFAAGLSKDTALAMLEEFGGEAGKIIRRSYEAYESQTDALRNGETGVAHESAIAAKAMGFSGLGQMYQGVADKQSVLELERGLDDWLSAKAARIAELKARRAELEWIQRETTPKSITDARQTVYAVKKEFLPASAGPIIP